MSPPWSPQSWSPPLHMRTVFSPCLQKKLLQFEVSRAGPFTPCLSLPPLAAAAASWILFLLASLLQPSPYLLGSVITSAAFFPALVPAFLSGFPHGFISQSTKSAWIFSANPISFQAQLRGCVLCGASWSGIGVFLLLPGSPKLMPIVNITFCSVGE